jgi:signal transduction histidine kinase
MTFKSIVPIYGEKGSFLGIFEIITHFNSISTLLEQDNANVIIIADKKYKNQLKKSLTKKFIDGYYIATLNPNKKALAIIEDIGIEKIIKMSQEYLSKYYLIDKTNKIYVSIYDINHHTGYIVVLKTLDTFDMSKIYNLKRNIFITTLLILIVLIAIVIYLRNKKYKDILHASLETSKKEKKLLDSILSAQPYMIILLYNKQIDYVNQQFFEFFTQYQTLELFKQEHQNINDFFVQPENLDEIYIQNTKDWLDIIINENNKEYSVIMQNQENYRTFMIKATNPNIQFSNRILTILTLIDITEIKAKEKILVEQSKLASMGEMIGNIAHQWRQPLSVISTAATGMQLQQEYKILTDEALKKSCDAINDNAQYLSKTIDDFRDFIKGDKAKTSFSLKDTIDSFLNLVNGSIKTHNINIVIDLEKDVIGYGYKNELEQCFINIFNNSKDIFREKNIKESFFFLSTLKIDNKVVVTIKDNGGGIPKDVLPKIFEPYFTTKHESQGTGLGLHMTYNLIVDGMNGSIEAKNTTYTYQNQEYTGAKFIITLPIA